MISILLVNSPHYNTRPKGVRINLLVLHAISLPMGEFSPRYITALFSGCLDTREHPSFADLAEVRVSAHYLIDRQGHLLQFVADEYRAWHAGYSSWQGVEKCNDYSIGIEMIGDLRSPFTLSQYRSAASLSHHLMIQHPDITVDRIVSHADIAPKRKWDPGKQWHWARFHQYLNRKKQHL